MLARALAAALAAATLAYPASAQDAYVIGVTGALTGPAAGTNGPPIEGLRLYVDRLNAAGGINGKKIQLTVLDDQGEPSKAAAKPNGCSRRTTSVCWCFRASPRPSLRSSPKRGAPTWRSC